MSKQDIKLAVVGSRTFADQNKCWEILDHIRGHFGYNYVEIVSGDARGADTFGEAYADYHKIPKKIFPPEWKKYGPRAGYLRNIDIVQNCDVCVAFWDGESGGTRHDLELCKQYGKRCFVYNFVYGNLYEL